MESGQTLQSRIGYVLRWAAVIPGALIAVFIVMFPVHSVVMLQYTHNDEGSLSGLINPRTLESLANAFLTPLIFITAGAVIAPKHKLASGIVLATLLVPLYAWAATIILDEIHQGLYYKAVRWVRLGVTILLCFAGFAFGLRNAHNIQRESKT